MDHSTAHRERVGRVKVCVEVNAKKPRVDKISVTSDDMTKFFIGVEYCGLPRCCEKCQVFDHDCAIPVSGLTKNVWRVKKPQISAINEEEMVNIMNEVSGCLEALVVEKETGMDKGKAIWIATPSPVTPSALPS
ncbi:unnamed protein product [Linum trigynum]|uniref:Uncharacterized protein n=1 Tax=Linum trigynum TaxID=586398 RepID=A0AAV2E0P9_9ROSI